MMWGIMGYFSKQFKWTMVVFSARLQTDMGQIGAIGDNSVQHILKHFPIDFTVFEFCRSTCPSNIENVGHISEKSEPGLAFFCTRYVTLDILNRVLGIPRRSRAAGNTVDLPRTTGGVGKREDLGKTIADDTSDSDD